VIIVSDTSPINNLAAIGQLCLLKQLYGQVIIPEAVYQELTNPDFPVAGALEVQTLDWIQTQPIKNQGMFASLQDQLDPGEAAAIVLALELKATQLLIEQRRGRAIADRLEISYVGILGILVEAKSKGLIVAVKPLLDALIEQAGFWVAPPLYQRILQISGEIP
jgi:uncharacterized protein